MRITRVSVLLGIPLLLLSAAGAQTVPASAASTFRGMDNGNAAPGELSPLTLQQSYGLSEQTKVLAVMVGWFGSPKHVAVGNANEHAYSGNLSGEVRVVAVGKALFLDQVSNTITMGR